MNNLENRIPDSQIENLEYVVFSHGKESGKF
mgnify:CR=1 FL=1